MKFLFITALLGAAESTTEEEIKHVPDFAYFDDDLARDKFPAYNNPALLGVKIEECNEPLVDVTEKGVKTLSGSGWWYGIDDVFRVENRGAGRFMVRQGVCDALIKAQEYLQKKIDKFNKTTTPRIHNLTIHLVEGYRSEGDQSLAYQKDPQTQAPLRTTDSLHEFHPGRRCGATVTVFPVSNKFVGTYPQRLYRTLGCTTDQTDETWKSEYKPKQHKKQLLREKFMASMSKAGFTNLGRIDLWEMGTRYTVLMRIDTVAKYGSVTFKSSQ